MNYQRIRIYRTLTYRDAGNLANAVEQAGGCAYIQKNGRLVSAGNLIGLLSLRLTAGDVVTLVDKNGAAATTILKTLTVDQEGESCV